MFFLPNFPGAMFIQGVTFIPDFRVWFWPLEIISDIKDVIVIPKASKSLLQSFCSFVTDVAHFLSFGGLQLYNLEVMPITYFFDISLLFFVVSHGYVQNWEFVQFLLHTGLLANLRILNFSIVHCR